MYSQLSQDDFVNRLLNIDDGFFLDIGAGTGGITGQPIGFYSNTYLLENQRHWNGIAIDYDQVYIDRAKKERSCTCICEDLLKTSINEILSTNMCPRVVDYLSFDVDDATEMVLNELDFTKYEFKVITFEHNLFQAITSVQNHTKEHKDYIKQFHSYSREKFKSLGYRLLHADVMLEGYGPVEDWYINPTYINRLDLEETALKNHAEII